MAKVKFDSLFILNSDGSIEPKQTARIGGVTIGPGAKFSGDVSLGGVSVSQLINKDLEITTDDGIIVITGIY